MRARHFLFLLTPLLVALFPGSGLAQSDDCSPTLTRETASSLPQVRAAGLRRCTVHWEGRLLETGAWAEVKVELGQEVPAGLMDELVMALRRADLDAVNLGRILGPERVQLLVLGPGAVAPAVRASAAASTYSAGPHCHILYLHDTWTDAEQRDLLAWVIAHEFFHCLQASTVPELYRASPEWVIEGSATWYGHYVVPNVPHFWADAFERYVSRLPVHRHDGPSSAVPGYRNWVLFAWISQYFGPEFVTNTLLNMPASAENAEAVMNSLEPEAWGEFVYWYNSDLIRTRDGRRIERPDRYETDLSVIPDGETEATIVYARRTATMMRNRVELGAGVWEFRAPRGTEAIILELDDAGQTTGISDRLARGWATVEVDCRERTEFLVAQMADSNADLEVTIRQLEDTCASACDEVPRRADQCLVGSWEVLGADANFENSAFIGMARLMALFGGGSLDVVDVHSETFRFAPDGTFTSNRPMTFAGRTPEARMRMEVVRNTDTGRWGVNGGRLTVCTDRNDFEAIVSGANDEGGGSETIRSNERVTDEPAASARYTCEGNTLTLQSTPSMFFRSPTIRLRRLSTE